MTKPGINHSRPAAQHVELARRRGACAGGYGKLVALVLACAWGRAGSLLLGSQAGVEDGGGCWVLGDRECVCRLRPRTRPKAGYWLPGGGAVRVVGRATTGRHWRDWAHWLERACALLPTSCWVLSLRASEKHSVGPIDGREGGYLARRKSPGPQSQ
ncbi:hypothetical protein DFH27DRAFT_257602 [Peziza echinospora]|nr:hypothetical protein DFH27DRAFT_257602 [Peziza echinospora]